MDKNEIEMKYGEKLRSLGYVLSHYVVLDGIKYFYPSNLIVYNYNGSNKKLQNTEIQIKILEDNTYSIEIVENIADGLGISHSIASMEDLIKILEKIEKNK